jgi:hypothetical protein
MSELRILRAKMPLLARFDRENRSPVLAERQNTTLE